MCPDSFPPFPFIFSHMLSRLTAPWLIRRHDYVEEVGPKSPYYNFMMQAKHLVSWPRVAFATLSCAAVSWVAYGSTATLILLTSVLVATHISGAWGDYYLGGVMGDFLGATICLTELVVLTTIILLSDTSSTSLDSYMSNTFEKLSSNNEGLNGILAWIASDARMRYLLWFLALNVAMKVWCDNVGFSADMLRAELPAVNEEKDGHKNEPSPDATTTDTPRQILNQQFQTNKGDNTSTVPVAGTFSERYNQMREYIDSLAKPVGSLGALEDWSARLSALQQSAFPKITNVACAIFVGDHGVAAPEVDGGEECSSYPQAVTQKILQALDHGMAGASILAKANGVTSMHVVDVGVIGSPPLKAEGGVVTTAGCKLTNGTRNFCKEAAMTAEEVELCLQEGRNTASKCMKDEGGDVLVIGEVGIGNTTAASALLAALTGADTKELCDGGATLSRTVDQTVVDRKVDIVQRGLKLHGKCQNNPSKALRCFGSAEICGMVGAVLECSLLNKPVLVDGFIATTAAYIATLISPSATRILFLATKSSERGQSYAIEGIQQAAQDASLPPPSPPALNMSLRMGEASAALVAVPLLKSAAAILDISTLNDVMSIPTTSS
jgi:nicotinate-nucleotide--dimethylbenzimidazole phosphoribosyltransferase